MKFVFSFFSNFPHHQRLSIRYYFFKLVYIPLASQLLFLPQMVQTLNTLPHVYMLSTKCMHIFGW